MLESRCFNFFPCNKNIGPIFIDLNAFFIRIAAQNFFALRIKTLLYLEDRTALTHECLSSLLLYARALSYFGWNK